LSLKLSEPKLEVKHLYSFKAFPDLSRLSTKIWFRNLLAKALMRTGDNFKEKAGKIGVSHEDH
jgi:hypothetical protein